MDRNTDPFPGFDDDADEDNTSVVGADGRVRVLADQCDTCVFHPGNLMRLGPGRLKEIVDANRRSGAGLTCHETLHAWPGTTDPAWCRGFYDRYDTASRRLAEHLMGITEVPPPGHEEGRASTTEDPAQ